MPLKRWGQGKRQSTLQNRIFGVCRFPKSESRIKGQIHSGTTKA